MATRETAGWAACATLARPGSTRAKPATRRGWSFRRSPAPVAVSRCRARRKPSRNRLGKEVELGRLRPMMRSAQNCAIRSGRSVAWYARLLGVQKVVSSNLTAPTIFSQGFLTSRRFPNRFLTLWDHQEYDTIAQIRSSAASSLLGMCMERSSAGQAAPRHRTDRKSLYVMLLARGREFCSHATGPPGEVA